jgi:hypothetical protein
MHYFSVDHDGYMASSFRWWSNIANAFFVITAIFYFICSCMVPGYVKAEYDFIVINIFSLPIIGTSKDSERKEY